MPELVECRNCSRQVSKEAEECPNCREKYPSLSAVEMQKHYSHCISCGERLLINDYISEHGNMYDYDSDCPQCGQPKPIQDRYVSFPPPPKTSSCVYAIGIAVIIFIIFTIAFLILEGLYLN